MIKELLKKSRSYRGFDESRVITREELLDLVDCARYAPASRNLQPFQYYLVYEKSEAEQILLCTKWAAALPDLQLPREGEHPGAFIIICQDSRIGKNLAAFQKDIGVVAQTMLLAAADSDLGGCMIANFNPKKIRQVTDLPEYLEPVLVVAIGKPIERVVVTEINYGEDTKYYRDKENCHYVPKRKLGDIIVK